MNRAFGSQSLSDILTRSAALRPNDCAVSIDGIERSFAEVQQNAERKARQILSVGLVPGDRLGILLPNSVEFLEILLGASMVGIVIVPVNTRFKAIEVRHIVVDSGMSALVTSEGIPGVTNFPELLAEALPTLRAAQGPGQLSLPEAPLLRALISCGPARKGFFSFSDLNEFDGVLQSKPTADSPLMLMYTSGTTAHPKGCIVPHRALIENARAIVERFEITSKDVWWCPLPMFHIGGLLFFTVMLHSAGLYIGMSHFTPDAAFDLFGQYPPTVLYSLFPTLTLALTDHPRFAASNKEALRFVFSVAPADVQRNIQRCYPDAILLSAFGMTETCGTVSYSLVDHSVEQRMSTCGVPLPGWEVKIVDAIHREPVGAGCKGEIAVRGPGLFDGYFNDAALTQTSFDESGFFLTGDVGSLDEDGLLTFHGRLKDQLKVGGENVSALEVESFLASHPAIKLAQVVGVADEKYGEVPVAFVELAADQTVTAEEIIQFCYGKIARFKVPRHVRVVREWPMSATKILKYQLKEQIEAEILVSVR